MPLIGFAGAPFTVASYLIEGGPSRDYAKTKTLMYADPATWAALLDRLADLALASLRAQVAAGAAAVQLFDSWAGMLSPADYRRYVLPATTKVFAGPGRPRRAPHPLRGGHRRAARAHGRRRRRRGRRRLAGPARPGPPTRRPRPRRPGQPRPGALPGPLGGRRGRGPGGAGRRPGPDRATSSTWATASCPPPTPTSWPAWSTWSTPTPTRAERHALRVAVVGGGIAGLAAAWELTSRPATGRGHRLRARAARRQHPDRDFPGHRVDTGADAFIARVPDGVALSRELGLDDELVAPAAGRALIWSAGACGPSPTGLVLGAPARLRPLLRSGILCPGGRAAGRPRPGPAPDAVARRPERRRPGGPAASAPRWPSAWSTRCSAASTPAAPKSCRPRRPPRSWPGPPGATAACCSACGPCRRPADGPLFLAPRGGMGRLVDRLVEALDQRGVRFEALTVSRIVGEKGGAVVLEPFGAFDAAVVATPAAAATDLLLRQAPDAADELRGIRTASVVLATLAYRRSELAVPDGTSGFLGGPGRGPADDGVLVRLGQVAPLVGPRHHGAAGLGGPGGRRAGPRAATTTWSTGSSTRWPRPSAPRRSPFHWRVSRWPEAFPQYDVGHLAGWRGSRRRCGRDLPGVALAGASLRGSGIPACIASGRARLPVRSEDERPVLDRGAQAPRGPNGVDRHVPDAHRYEVGLAYRRAAPPQVRRDGQCRRAPAGRAQETGQGEGEGGVLPAVGPRAPERLPAVPRVGHGQGHDRPVQVAVLECHRRPRCSTGWTTTASGTKPRCQPSSTTAQPAAVSSPHATGVAPGQPKLGHHPISVSKPPARSRARRR